MVFISPCGLQNEENSSCECIGSVCWHDTGPVLLEVPATEVLQNLVRSTNSH